VYGFGAGGLLAPTDAAAAAFLPDQNRLHSSLEAAPTIPREVARALDAKLQDVGMSSRGQVTSGIPAGNRESDGRAVVITGAGSTGLPSVAACLEALGLTGASLAGYLTGRLAAAGEVEVQECDFSRAAFPFSPGEVEGLVERTREDPMLMDLYELGADSDVYAFWDELYGYDLRAIEEVNALLVHNLTDHFYFTFGDFLVTYPVLYGGRARDGNIVAILASECWA